MRGYTDNKEEVARRLRRIEGQVRGLQRMVMLDGRVAAAVSVSGPVGRTSREPGRRYAAPWRPQRGRSSGGLR